MKLQEHKEKEKNIDDVLNEYVDKLYARGYNSEDIVLALDKMRSTLSDKDVKIANGNISSKTNDMEYRYKVVRESDVGELNHPKYVMTDGSLGVFPLVCRVDDLKTEILDKTYYLFDDLSKKEQEEYAKYVEIIISEYPIIKSNFFGLVKFSSRKRKKGSK